MNPVGPRGAGEGCLEGGVGNVLQQEIELSVEIGGIARVARIVDGRERNVGARQRFDQLREVAGENGALLGGIARLPQAAGDVAIERAAGGGFAYERAACGGGFEIADRDDPVLSRRHTLSRFGHFA